MKKIFDKIIIPALTIFMFFLGGAILLAWGGIYLLIESIVRLSEKSQDNNI